MSQDAADFLQSLEKVLEQFARAMLHISRGYALPEDDFQILSVSHGPASTARDPWKTQTGPAAEAVVSRAPRWNSEVPAPASWFPEQGLSDTTVWVYISTPLGPGLAQITRQAAARSMKEEGGKLCVSVALCQHYLPSTRSHTVHRSCSNAELADGARSPADSVSSAAGSGPSGLGRKSELAKTVHLHCQVATSDSAPAADSAGKDSGQGSSTEGELLGSASPTASSQEALPERKGSGAAEGMSLSEAVAGLELLLILSLVAAAVAHRKGWLQESLPPAFRTAADVVMLNGEGAKKHMLLIKLLKAEVVDRQRAGRAQSLSILQRRTSMALPDSSVNIESDTGSLDSPTGFGKDVVNRFMIGYGNDKAAARRAMQRTYDWRKATGTFNILDQAQPHFETFKAGMMREGWQKFKVTGLNDRDVARHIAFCHDFLYKVLDTEPMPEGGRTIWINDLKGVGIRDIGSKAMDFGLQMMGLLEKHYPERMGKALVVNAPSFFNVLWRIVHPLIPASTKKRLVVLRSKEDVHKALLEYMDDKDIPSEYGGKSEKQLYETEPERALKRRVEEVKGSNMSPMRSWRLSSDDLDQ
ncbi:hypothetical protein COCSUDRAFT_62530 [Coccomyxa subellipsoidea C-169]|uniref:CRAL-TRIO domain-containing protein n=1 Tax=Coccomyxa subellipsoidea (strain C-169) TaxID=574566 RepID=I0Z035_COCSC|nr:hypothetical protein COCSUDRAFT_62530 [Coccomyxa subellipsoidea C-169]EIE24004.1 hypothetical protein COCSUDRAFT_62530 [Coccomyxa subellipsoidea C-169]|eukprot:XP_005648548.1 hypothetical protein COCSUDRAFT_62530 [Coccomyxa subellipsoidea C-169]